MRTITCAVLAAAACGGGGGSGGGGDGDGGGGGGSSITAHQVGSDALGDCSDAALDPTGATLYFSKVDFAAHTVTVYSAPASGGPSTVVSAMTNDAFGVTYAEATSTLLITSEGGSGVGVLALDPAGGSATLLGSAPGQTGGSLDVNSTTRTVYFVAEGLAYSLPLAGGSATPLAGADSITDAFGIAVDASAATETVYVSGGGFNTGFLYKVSGGSATPLSTTLDIGATAGIALSPDGSTVFVNAQTPDFKQVEVDAFDTATGVETRLSTTIAGADGGMHRAAAGNVDAMCAGGDPYPGGIFIASF